MSGRASKLLIRERSLFLRLNVQPPRTQRLTHSAYSKYVFDSIGTFADVLYCRPSFVADNMVQTQKSHMDMVLASSGDLSRLSAVIASLVGIDTVRVGRSKPLESKSEILERLYTSLDQGQNRDHNGNNIMIDGIYVNRAQGKRITTVQGTVMPNIEHNFQLKGWEQISDQNAVSLPRIYQRKRDDTGVLGNPEAIGISAAYFNEVQYLPPRIRHWLYGIDNLETPAKGLEHKLSRKDKHSLDIMLHGFKGF